MQFIELNKREMQHIVKSMVFTAPIVITFLDNVGYIARVDGKRWMFTTATTKYILKESFFCD